MSRTFLDSVGKQVDIQTHKENNIEQLGDYMIVIQNKTVKGVKFPCNFKGILTKYSPGDWE